MLPSTMGLHLSKDETSRSTSKATNEVRGPMRKMSLTSHRRASSARIAKHGVVNVFSRDASSKANGIKSRYVADDDTVSTRGSRILSSAVVDKEPSSHAAGIMGLFKRQPFATEHGLPRAAFRQDPSARLDPSSLTRTPCASEDIEGEERSSSPLPIPTSTVPTSLSEPTVVDEDHEVDHLRRVYDMRTWNMYIRIIESRRHSNYQSQTPANSYACGSSMTMDHHCDLNAGCHSSSEYDEGLMFDLE